MGRAHEGSIGVLLADRTEPGPVYFDVGSGAHVPSSTQWHAYDGRVGRPKAALLRGACACGWRGAAEYPLDWSALDQRRPLYEADVDLDGPIADYKAHLMVVREAAVALPASLVGLLASLKGELESAALQEPLVALKALADLRYLIDAVGSRATLAVQAGRVPLETVATALGTSEPAARGYLRGYRWP
ncbi:hypothetical protein [Streptomyces sp. NPDC047014]|uniref:hypothetical protein n=1 Tax=Streptomyces sp. NPDC047014 TaxID=3155736 RepID=UPI0033DAC149